MFTCVTTLHSHEVRTLTKSLVPKNTKKTTTKNLYQLQWMTHMALLGQSRDWINHRRSAHLVRRKKELKTSAQLQSLTMKQQDQTIRCVEFSAVLKHLTADTGAVWDRWGESYFCSTAVHLKFLDLLTCLYLLFLLMHLIIWVACYFVWTVLVNSEEKCE